MLSKAKNKINTSKEYINGNIKDINLFLKRQVAHYGGIRIKEGFVQFILALKLFLLVLFVIPLTPFFLFKKIRIWYDYVLTIELNRFKESSKRLRALKWE